MKPKRLKFLLIGIGVLCLLGALCLAGYNLWESREADITSQEVVEQLIPILEEKKPITGASQPDYITYPDMEMPTAEIDGVRFVGYLEIPALELRLPVAGGEFRLKQLRKTPALYSGSAYRRDMVIAAHNYNSHFGRLDRLEVGDEVLFTDAAGNTFRYTVGWSETVAPSDREQMIDGEGWDLTLFTCTYSGAQRFTLRCIAEELN